MERNTTLYSRLGERDTISRLTNTLFSHIMADNQLGKYWESMCDDGINKNRQYLLDYLCANTGGPELYSGRDNKTAHKGMDITEQDWTKFITHLTNTLDGHGIINPEKDEVLKLFANTKNDIVEVKPTVKRESLFERIGSLSKVQELASEFYDVMDKESFAKDLREIHPENLFMSKKSLAKFIAQWLGGPKLFGDQYVNVTWLELRHRRFELSEKNKQQWLYCMDMAMTNVGIEDGLKRELHRKFEGMINSMQLQRDRIKNKNI